MGLQKKPQMVEAVMFFNERGICKEMLYPEFEALLDGVVNLPAFADQQVRTAFVLINPRLLVKAVVCFYIDFGEQGEADRGWNIPLRHLADRTGAGPDLGAGPIRLACRSQCPVSWHQMHLWDPSLSPARNDLLLIRDAARRNNLGVLVEDDSASAVEPERLHMAPEHKWYVPDEEEQARAAEAARRAGQLEREQRLKAAQLLRQQRLRIASLIQRHEEELARLRQQAEQREQALQQRLLELKQALTEQAQRNEALKARFGEQAAGFQQAREALERQLKAQAQDERNLVESLRAEAEARIAAAVFESQEHLARLDARLTALTAEETRLRGELARLTEERDRLAGEGGEQTLARLAARGVVFVAYHPGVGHLTLPLQDLAVYQTNPLAYVAGKCFVGEAHYRQWLAHYQQPACTALLANGSRCNMPIDRVESPSRFVPGESDCCSRHRAGSRQRPLGER